MGFVAINPNPKNRLVGDCVIRAISVATDETWNDVYLDLLGKGYEMKDMPSANNVWGTYLHDIGYERYIIPDTCGITNNCFSRYEVEFTGNIAIPTGGDITPIATAIVVSGEQRDGSRSIFTPAAVNEYGSVTSRATVDVPRGCCFTVAVEYVNGTVDDPATVPTPLINVIDGSLTITRVA